MAIKKSELYSSLWKGCDELRGGMDASQYKDYVLVLLFMKYVSDKAASQKDYLLDVPAGGRFADMVALKNDKEIGDKINKVIRKFADTNHLQGVIDVADFNDETKLGRGKEMVDRLTNLIGIFEGLDFGGNRAEGDDLLGDAYEYLMRNFATESGKSKGQFYTPAEVSRVMAQVVGVGNATDNKQTIYDPACGSGSLLLKAHDEAKNRANLDLALYGQEMDNATAALARMNTILHGSPTAEIWQDNTLAAPHFTDPKTGALKTFDFVVANPPFSNKAWSNGLDAPNDRYGRFALGVPPTKNGDFAFLLHMLASLKSNGKGAIILPHGVLFRGNAEADLRKAFIQRGYIKGIIGLPPNLFYGTGIPACIIVLDKENAHARKGIFMLDASKHFRKDGNKNRLREQDIHKIVDVFNRQIEQPGYARTVPLSEIGDPKNDFNLNLPRYIDGSAPEDLHDLEGHLRGGIPERDVDALADYWRVLPSLRAALFAPARPGYQTLRVAASEVKPTVLAHEETNAFRASAQRRFEAWQHANAPRLRNVALGDKPKALIQTLSEDMLRVFQQTDLLDAYDLYQRLMDYWEEAMQDDVYIVCADGWLKGGRARELLQTKDGKTGKMVWREAHDYKLGNRRFKSDLIPRALMIAQDFAAEQAQLDQLEAETEAHAQRIEALAEEHGGTESEEGLLSEVVDDSGKLTRNAVAKRVKEIQGKAEFADELAVLHEALAAFEAEAESKAQLKAAREALEEKLHARYAVLSEDETKQMVVQDKWLAALHASVQAALESALQTLSARARQLAERYAQPLPQLVDEVDVLAARVAQHLVKMGERNA